MLFLCQLSNSAKNNSTVKNSHKCKNTVLPLKSNEKANLSKDAASKALEYLKKIHIESFSSFKQWQMIKFVNLQI